MQCKVSDESDDCARRNEKWALRKINGRAVHNRICAPITASVDYTRVRCNISPSAMYHCFSGRGMWGDATPRTILKMEMYRNFCIAVSPFASNLFAKDDRSRRIINCDFIRVSRQKRISWIHKGFYNSVALASHKIS